MNSSQNKKRAGKSLFVFLPLFVLLASFNLYAERGDLKVIGVQGDVQITASGAMESELAQTGALLSEGDTISAGTDSAAVLRLEEYGKITVSSNSELRIDKKELQDEIINARLNLSTGTIKGNFKKLPDGSLIELATPTAVAAVRGTILYVGYVNGVYTVYCPSGSITVTTPGGQTMDLAAGQAASVDAMGDLAAMDPNSAEFQAALSSFEVVDTQESNTVVVTTDASGTQSVQVASKSPETADGAGYGSK